MSAVGGDDRGVLDAEPDDRQRHDQPGPGTGDADVEQLLAIGPRAFHADHGAHRAGHQHGHGNEERQAGRHAVAHGLQEVAHFVRQQDADHRGHVDQALLPVGRDHAGDLVVLEVDGRVPVERPGHERRRAGGHEQEHRQHDAASARTFDVGSHQFAQRRPGARSWHPAPSRQRIGRVAKAPVGRGRRRQIVFAARQTHHLGIAAACVHSKGVAGSPHESDDRAPTSVPCRTSRHSNELGRRRIGADFDVVAVGIAAEDLRDAAIGDHVLAIGHAVLLEQSLDRFQVVECRAR